METGRTLERPLLLHRWNRAAADAGFAESEYYNEPEAVFARVRQEREMRSRSVILGSAIRDFLAAVDGGAFSVDALRPLGGMEHPSVIALRKLVNP